MAMLTIVITNLLVILNISTHITNQKCKRKQNVEEQYPLFQRGAHSEEENGGSQCEEEHGKVQGLTSVCKSERQMNSYRRGVLGDSTRKMI